MSLPSARPGLYQWKVTYCGGRQTSTMIRSFSSRDCFKADLIVSPEISWGGGRWTANRSPNFASSRGIIPPDTAQSSFPDPGWRCTRSSFGPPCEDFSGVIRERSWRNGAIPVPVETMMMRSYSAGEMLNVGIGPLTSTPFPTCNEWASLSSAL